MPLDSEPIVAKPRDDLISIVMDVFGGIQYKLIGLMFVVFLVVTSDVFVSRVLAKIDGAVDFKTPTNYGAIIQGACLVIAVLIMDALIRLGVA